jgi:hypothetical protein
MFSAVILATGIYIMWFGGVVHHLPLSVPNPHGVCQADRELGKKLQERLERLVIEPGAIQEALIKENLAAPYPYDWCAPRLKLRPTIIWWDADVWNRGGSDMPPVIITMPRRRPTFVPAHLVLKKLEQPRPPSLAATAALRPAAKPTPPVASPLGLRPTLPPTRPKGL